MKYIWQQSSWPHFTWDDKALLSALGETRFIQGALLGELKALGLDIQENAGADILVEEAMKTSAIEGEILDREAVRSSVGRRLGLPTAGLQNKQDQKADGVVAILHDAVTRYAIPLTPKRLWGWHAALFPTGYSGLSKIDVGLWRDDHQGPMRIISGPIGRETIHFEAPPAQRIETEMTRLIPWVNSSSDMDGIFKAAVAHLWFITIHPFDDGNGRIARTLTDMLLAKDENNPQRIYSLSSQIMRERDAYYDILERTQAGTGEITEWLMWFLHCMHRAIRHSKTLLEHVMIKAAFWKAFAQTPLHERQVKVLNRLLDAGPGGFEGGLKNKKYMGIAHTSRATAQRELADLVQKGLIICLSGGGRSTSYDIDWDRWRSDT